MTKTMLISPATFSRRISKLAALLLLFACCATACRRRGNADELVMMLEKTVTTFDPRKSADSAD
ncbi:MAG: hypothetical protein C4321_05545, partial [Chloroflexota bacterium]